MELDEIEMAEWGELGHDFQNAHSALINQFGGGVQFDGKLWEEEKCYHARTIYLKWVGSRALHDVTVADGEQVIHPPMNPMVSII